MYLIDKGNENAILKKEGGTVQKLILPEDVWQDAGSVSEDLLELSDAEFALIHQAFELARRVHSGQKDKSGKDYIYHPLRVSQLTEGGVTEMMVALLHDVVEDTPTSLADLKQMGFPDEVVDGVDHMTRRKEETRDEYLKRLKPNATARKVKLADLIHNSDLTRFAEPSEKDLRRAETYAKEMEYLRS